MPGEEEKRHVGTARGIAGNYVVAPGLDRGSDRGEVGRRVSSASKRVDVSVLGRARRQQQPHGRERRTSNFAGLVEPMEDARRGPGTDLELTQPTIVGSAFSWRRSAVAQIGIIAHPNND